LRSAGAGKSIALAIDATALQKSESGESRMYMRIVWGKISPGKWNEFEMTFKAAMAKRGELDGLVNHWLAHDQKDADAGYSITLWRSEADMLAFWESPRRKEVMAQLEPFYVNQYTTTHCEVRYALNG
jgi:heme-degrading monooxygenase HmoA